MSNSPYLDSDRVSALRSEAASAGDGKLVTACDAVLAWLRDEDHAPSASIRIVEHAFRDAAAHEVAS